MRADRRSLDRQDRTVIELLIDAHDGHAGFGLAVFDRALNRRGAAVLRQDRRVHIHKSPLRNLQESERQNLAVGDDDADVGMHRFNLGQCIANLCRLKQRQSELVCLSRDRRGLQLQSAPSALVRLGHDECNVVFTRESFKRGDSEFGSAQEYDAQRGGIVRVVARSALYGGVARCVPVTAVDVVCVACWLFAGGGPSSAGA